MINKHILIIAALNILIGAFIYLKKPKKQTHIAFGLLFLSLSLWLTSLLILVNSKTHGSALLWGRLTFTVGMLVPTSLLHFISGFPNRILKPPKLLVIYTPGLLAIILTLTPLVIKDVKMQTWGLEPVIGPGYFLIVLFVLSYLIFTVWGIVTRFRHAQREEKLQLIYIMMGFSVFILHILITNLVLPVLGFKNIYLWGPWATVEMGAILGYAMVRYRLLDIEIVIKRTSLYLLLVAIITGLYTFILMLPHKFIGPPGSPGSIGLMIAAAILIAITVQPLRDWLDAVTDRLFFQKKYDYYQVMEKVAHELNTVINLPDALNVVARPLINDMHLKSVGFYLREKAGEAHYICRKKAGPDSELLPEYAEEENPVVNYLVENKGILEAGEFRHRFGHLYSGDKILDPQKAKIQEALDTTFQAGLLVPLLLKQNLMGFAVLGEKRSGDQFTQRDLALLDLMAGQMVITLENIKMYEQMLNNERLTIIGTMSAGIAHEIRNPLASIKAFVQMLPMKYDKPAFRKRFDEIIPSEIDRISGITENLLAFSKPSPLKLEQVFIRNVVDRVVMLLSSQLRKNQIEIVRMLDNIPVIQADTQQITQVFLNLILNAIQASNNGGKIKVMTEAREKNRQIPDGSNSHIMVSVTDEGEGIKKINMSNIFQPFFTTKTEGTGLGLPTCKRIIEAHHGGIWVESEEGQGARFTLRLPVNLTLEAV